MSGIDIDMLWEQALSIINKQVSKPSFDTWLKPTKLIRFDNENMIIEVPNEFAKDWLTTRYNNLIRSVLQKVINEEVVLTFVMPDSGELSSVPDINNSTQHFPNILNDNDVFSAYHNSKYTFESFVVGHSNEFAYEAALSVSKSPAGSYNPLFIYGGTGLGKTHLLQAIGYGVFQHNPNAKIRYISSETFIYDLIDSIRDDKIIEFRNKYRGIDILLIDDVQLLAGKERTQEEFFNTFNTLYEAHKQIVISSSKPPKLIPVLEESIRSRFEGGLIVDINPPEIETRVAILNKIVESESINVPSIVITYIAEQFHSNIRELQGALLRVVSYASVKQKQITLNLAREALKGILP